MSSINVQARHAGKTYTVQADANATGIALKQSIYEVTGVPTDRMKVMISGAMLKDQAALESFKLKEGQVLTVIGTAGPLPSAPLKQTVFVEDLDPSHVDLMSGDPAGLVNLGQTCYLNSCLQVLRGIPQLNTALGSYQPSGHTAESSLTRSLKDLFGSMSKSTGPVAPFLLLSSLRSLSPQFAEQDRQGGFAQQDADEAWTQLISALRGTLPGGGESTSIEDLMHITFQKTLRCIENPEEDSTNSSENSLKLECNITVNTNFLLSGILDNLDQQVEKYSPTLGRSAIYDQKTRITRLPKYLTVHMVRFYWRRDIQKKAKIMRKVKFPLQLDLMDLVSDEVRNRLQPINAAARQMLSDRDDRAKMNKRNHMTGVTQSIDNELDRRKEEDSTIRRLSAEKGCSDMGNNPTAIYELCAMITHKGATADSGHYIGWTKKTDPLAASGEEEWYKFDDDKVSTVKADKITSMDGGGEDSVAYLLLYRASVS